MMTLFVKQLETYWLYLTALTLLTVTVLSLMPGDGVVSLSNLDKVKHFSAYMGIIFFVALKRPKHFWLFFIGFIAWGGGIELIQPYVGRTADWLDVLANTGGLVLGVVFGLWFRRMFLEK
jgi:VanZ family protein